MTRLTAIDPTKATGEAKPLLDAVQAKLGITPNMMRTMANSPAVLQGYLNFSGALAEDSLNAQVRELIALAVCRSQSLRILSDRLKKELASDLLQKKKPQTTPKLGGNP